MIYILTNQSPLWLKQTPEKSSKNIGVIKPGDIFTVTNEIDDWYQIKTGYLYKYNSDGELVADSNISKVSQYEKYQNTENIESTLYDGDHFPSEMTSWNEGNRKIVVMPSDAGDGTWTKVVSYEVNGELHNDTYVYTKEKTLSTTHTTGPHDRQNRDVRNEDGTRYVEEYININGVDTKVTSTYDKNGVLVGQSTQPTYADSSILAALHEAGFGQGKIDGNKLNLTMTTVAGIHGIPYQFMPIVDSRDNSRAENIGRMYADRVVARMPLFIITPGEPEFLAGWSEEERREGWKALLTSEAASGTLAAQIATRQGRYYVFKSRFDLYAMYLNNLMRAAAFFLNIQDVKYNGIAFGSYRWENNYNKDIHSKLNYHQAIAFYIHSDTQISDSFGNDSRPSQLAEKVNGLSDLAKEVQFLTGTTGAMTGIGALTDLTNGNEKGKDLGNVENMTDFTNQLLGSGDFIKAITGNIATIIQGGKLIFPEIWGDSHFTKTYSVTLKLRCPNPDPVSWYLDIWAPVAHLLPMVLPKMSGPNGYVAPFLVRAYYKGLFNCQMGIITDMTVTRGDMGNWTLDGLPTSVDVTLQIKDLYTVLGISGENNSWSQILNNIGMLDYVANFCGINVNVPDIERLLTYGMYLLQNTPGDMVGRLGLTLDVWANNLFLGIAGRR